MNPRPALVWPLAALAIGLGAATAVAAPEAVRRLPSAGSAIHFVVDVPEPRLVPFAGESGVTRLELDGYGPIGAVGAPALAERIVIVAVPPSGEVRVTAAGGATSTLEDALLAPMPRLVGARGAERERFDRSARAYGSAGGASHAPARLIGVSWLRNQRVARIAVEPATYDPAARRVNVFRQVDVSVEVTPAEATGTLAEPDDPFEPVYRDLLVNYDQGRVWRMRESMLGDGRRRA